MRCCQRLGSRERSKCFSYKIFISNRNSWKVIDFHLSDLSIIGKISALDRRLAYKRVIYSLMPCYYGNLQSWVMPFDTIGLERGFRDHPKSYVLRLPVLSHLNTFKESIPLPLPTPELSGLPTT